MSDSLNLLAKMVGRIEGGGAFKDRFIERIIPDTKPAPQKEQTAEEIYPKSLKDLGGKQ